MKTESEIMDDLRQILRNFEGREYSGNITPQTMFFADLGFASLDAILLGEQLESYYARSIPFPSFLGSLAERNVQDIEVGELARFLSRL
ncbi:MAG: hypothetical protein KDA60_01900 [Planctomycetales bacterium]|nr:hypothetical protein [Planctomycetales bacterium]